MDRRRFLHVMTGSLLAPLAARAQQAGKVWRIGVLMSLYGPDAEAPQALKEGLRSLGYVEGQNLVIDWRYAQGRDDRLQRLAVELIGLNPDVIIADITPAIRAAKQATSTIPIVMTNSADAVSLGLVSNLARPGGNVTGNSILLTETSVKRLQLLKETVPSISRVAVLWDPATPFHRPMLRDIAVAASSLRVQTFDIAVKSRGDLGDALAEIHRRRADAVMVNQGMAPAARGPLLDFVAKHRLPTMFLIRDYVLAGGLMSYAPNFPEMYRHAAVFVDKIFKGVRPADLPVEQPTKFELVINLKTAKAIGLTVPQQVLARADEVIQ